MIQATDLRIGNWVNNDDLGNTQVDEIYNNSVVRVWSNADYFYIGEESINPIPLTPDILEKCGFEEVEGNEYYAFFDLEGVRVYIHKIDGSAFISYGYATLDAYTNNLHLHQLQNIIYALTNNEITINL
jgi:hypothetical protein